VFAIRLAHFATLEDDPAFDGLNDFQHGNVRWVPGQGKTAAGTPDGTHQSRLRQALEDFGEEAFGDALLAAHLIDHHVLSPPPPG
jgi:hypothetical protein